MITVKRTITRETAEIDYRTRKPFVIQLVPGGKLLRIKTKGARRWFIVTVKQIWMQGAVNRAAELRAERKAAREAKRKERQHVG